MHTNTRALLACVAFAMLAGCASSTNASPGQGPSAITETTRISSTVGPNGALSADLSNPAHKGTVNASVANVWAVLPLVYDSLGIPATIANAGAHQYGNSGFEVRQKLAGAMVTRYFDCGANRGGSSAMSYDLFVTAVTSLEAAEGGKTSVSTLVSVKGKPITYSGDWVNCSSNGSLEQKMLDAISARLR